MSAMKSTIIRLEQFLHRLHGNLLFEWTTVAVILISSLSIGAKSYQLPAMADTVIHFLDSLITVYFLTEIVIRVIVAGGFRAFFRHGWNIFDFIIVAGSLIPVDESEYALLARLLRLFRVMRLIYIVPQLRVLISALLKVLPRISYVALMMFIIFYIYAAVGNILFAEINPDLWGDIGVAMLTLFRVATLEDWTDVMYETMAVFPLSWIFYVSFIFLSAFIFLNMMIGVILEALNEEYNAEEKAARAHRQAELDARLQRIEEQLQRLIDGASRDR